MPNPCGKTRPVTDPYEIWVAGDWTWKVLKKYQTPEREASNPEARWFCQVITPYTTSRGDLGDVYVREITSCATKVYPVE